MCDNLEGKGYVSIKNIEAAGPVPDYVQDTSTDGTGRFSVAVFHQLHCLVCERFLNNIASSFGFTLYLTDLDAVSSSIRPLRSFRREHHRTALPLTPLLGLP